MICGFSDRCGGCSLWGIPRAEQLRAKTDAVLELFRGNGLPEPARVRVRELPDRGLRDRLDFQVRGKSLGLWDKSKSGLVDLPACLQLSESLQAWLEDFRSLGFETPRAGVRLRVSFRGQRGVWLDLPNEETRRLFEERTFLEKLSAKAQVEIGQRRKALVFDGSRPRLLKDPVFAEWTRTWLGSAPLPLLSRVADFSQVGDVANRAIVQTLTELLPPGRRLVEFGSGAGNLSFPAALRFERTDCFESDPMSAEAFLRNREAFAALEPDREVRLQVGDFQRKTPDLSGVDTALLNPPRSGVGKFLAGLDQSPVRHLLYMSCYPESLARDMAALGPGWRCEDLVVIDQFPQTDHVEVMTLWSR